MAKDTAQDKDGMGMSRSQLVAEHLPLLRRYARALTGNQASGDAYVGAMLEALLQDGSLLDERHGPRAGLFKLFTQIWNWVSLNDNPDVATLALPPERRLSNITPLPRQAFLLLSLEGFSEEEVAFILKTDIAETRALTDAAGRPRDGGGNRHRRPDHRGRDFHRDGPREPREEPRPQRDWCRPHPCRCGGAGQEQEARPDPRRHPARRRLVGPGC